HPSADPPSPFVFCSSSPHRALPSFPTRRSSDLLALQLRLVLSVVNAVLCLWRRPLAFKPLAALAAGAFHSTLLISFTGTCAAAAVCTCHCVFLLKGGLIQRPLSAISRISHRNSCFSETIADFISNSPVL